MPDFGNIKTHKTKKHFYPQVSFQAHKGPIYSIIFAGSVLVSGGDEEVKLWQASDLLGLHQEEGKVIHEFKTKQAAQSRGSLSMYQETNGLAYDNKRQYLFGACGDNLGYIWDLQTMQLVSTLQGHTNYLHSVCAMPTTGQVCTSSEDGTVKLWDLNSRTAVGTLEVSPGKWVSSLALDRSEAWLVCGGGAKELAQYHLPSLTKSWAVATTGYIQALNFIDNNIACVGNEDFVYHYSFGGELTKKVRTSSPSLFSVTENQNSIKNKILVATGSSPKIDVCTPGYTNVAFSFSFQE